MLEIEHNNGKCMIFFCCSVITEFWHTKCRHVKYVLIWQNEVKSAPKTIGILCKMLCIVWSILGDSSLNGWRVITRTNVWLAYGRTHTHKQTQATTIPEGQNWPRVKMVILVLEINRILILFTGSWRIQCVGNCGITLSSRFIANAGLLPHGQWVRRF